MRRIVGSLIVDAGAVLTPFQRKMHSSAQQLGWKGDGLSCRRVPGDAAGWSVGACSDDVNIGATTILICLKDGSVKELKLEC
jgi:hypothetical protein